MKPPRLLALVLALPIAAALAAGGARVADLREALATDEPEALKAMAIEMVSRNEQDTALLDVVADRIAEGQGTQDAELSDALAWLCRPFANARAGRYKQFLDKLSDTAGTVRLRHYAAVVAVGLPDSIGPSYQPPSAAAGAAPVAPAAVVAAPPPRDLPKPAARPEPKPEPKPEARAKAAPVPVVVPTPPAAAVVAAPAPKATPAPAPKAVPAAPQPQPQAQPPPPQDGPPTPKADPAPLVTATVGGTYRLRPGGQLHTRPQGSGLTLDTNPGPIKLVSSTRNAEGRWWFAKGEGASGWVREGDLAPP